MISFSQRLLFVPLLIVLMCVLTGCVTVELNEALSKGDTQARSDFYAKPILNDVIVAIGRPDSELSKQLNNDHAIAFLGKKNTYILYQGGDDLEHISQLKLDAKNMKIDAEGNSRLYLRNKQFWGQLVLSYGDANAILASERMELEGAGFSEIKYENVTIFQKPVNIEGVIYPAIRFSDTELARLAVPRPISFFNPVDSKPPTNSARPLLAVAVATDVALAPLYVGLGAVGLAAYPFYYHEPSHQTGSVQEKIKDAHKREYKVSHILLGTEAEANAIAASLSQGDDFRKLAKEKSIDVGTGQNDGELGWAFLDVYPKTFAEAVLNLKKGETSKPVQTKYGWHIIKLDDLRDIDAAVQH
jgi:parvulin-like peptidyl-prolyl isomerase